MLRVWSSWCTWSALPLPNQSKTKVKGSYRLAKWATEWAGASETQVSSCRRTTPARILSQRALYSHYPKKLLPYMNHKCTFSPGTALISNLVAVVIVTITILSSFSPPLAWSLVARWRWTHRQVSHKVRYLPATRVIKEALGRTARITLSTRTFWSLLCTVMRRTASAFRQVKDELFPFASFDHLTLFSVFESRFF